MPPAKPSDRALAQTITRLLYEAKEAVRAGGKVLSKQDIEDTVLKALTSKAPEAFGDRKKIPPQPEWIAAYAASIGYPMDGQAWCDSYAQKGWMVGKAKMRDWQCACRNWKTNNWGQGGIALAVLPQRHAKDYTRL